MAIDSRAKGRTAELKCRDELRKLTSLQWERTPLSGALDAKHLMKGDLYVPGQNIKYCVEVKHYKDDHISTKLLTSKSPQFMKWWEQTVREAEQMSKEPLLIFKHNRSKWFCAFDNVDLHIRLNDSIINTITLNPEHITITLLDVFCKFEDFV